MHPETLIIPPIVIMALGITLLNFMPKEYSAGKEWLIIPLAALWRLASVLVSLFFFPVWYIVPEVTWPLYFIGTLIWRGKRYVHGQSIELPRKATVISSILFTGIPVVKLGFLYWGLM